MVMNKTTDTENDPLVIYSVLLLKDNAIVGKKRALEKARELAANIHY